jgi:glycosyltransferase involved in cell wall biosynthesis
MNLLIPHGFESNYVVGFARGLVTNNVELLVISSDDLAKRLNDARIPHCNIRGSQDERRPAWRKAANLIRYYFLLLWKIIQHRGATIHFCGLLTSRIILVDGLVLPVWLRFWSGRYLHTAHNALPHSREQSRFFHFAYRWIYRFPHIILTHSQGVAQQLQQDFAVETSRLSTISIGLNEEISCSLLTQAEARRQLNLPPSAPVALFFGKIEPYKGVDLLVEAWTSLQTPDARLLIAGFSPNATYAAQIRDSINTSDKAKLIEWRQGFVPNATVATLLAAVDVVVLPYRNIYQSGVVFLCLRHGVPLVATNVGSMSAYIAPETGIIAKSNDAAGIAQALDLFFSNRTRFDRTHIKASADKYRWDLQCALIRPLYQ